MGDEPSGPNRFERIDPGFQKLDEVLLAGSSLQITWEEGHLVMKVGTKNIQAQGTFPSLYAGIAALGEALLKETSAVPIPGLCEPDTHLAHPLLIEGGRIEVIGLASVLVCSIFRRVPDRTYTHRGAQHRLIRFAMRQGKGSTVLEAIETAVQSEHERITETLALD